MKVHRVSPAFEDARGSIADILEDEIIEHVSILTTRQGSVRGNHLHRATHQWLYITSGALRYVTRDGDAPPASGIVRAGDVLMTGPNEAHAIEALEDTTMVVMTRGPRGGREYESDTYRLDAPLIAPDIDTAPRSGDRAPSSILRLPSSETSAGHPRTPA